MRGLFFYIVIFAVGLWVLGSGVALAAVPSDPFFATQWYLDRISAPAAWEKTTGSRDVVVAVLDSGVDLDHPDLQENLWTNPGEVAGDGLDNDGNGFVDDVHGWDFVDGDSSATPRRQQEFDEVGVLHGSIIAGIIGAVGGNGQGIVGVNWQVSMMPVRILDSQGVGDSSAARQGIRYAVQNGADVINLSFTGPDIDTDLRDAIQEAYRAGVVIVAAVGNQDPHGTDLDLSPLFPACFQSNTGEDWVIGVAASDKNDDKAHFSNFSTRCVDISAPGVDMASTQFQDVSWPPFTELYGEGWSGTSIAAPLVSGAVALLKAYKSNLTPDQIKTILQLSVDPLRLSDSRYLGAMGPGRLNIARALETADAFVPPKPTQPSTAPSPVTGLLETVSSVTPGDYIRSPFFSTVYYVTAGNERRPFLDTQTFLTYATFDQVKVVTDATLPFLSLGAPMLPKPGVVLVKIQSDPRTYAVTDPGSDGKPVLRLIPSESEAIRLFGTAWADYVLDVPSTAWRWFAFGLDVGPQEILPMDGLKRRDSLR